MRPNPWHECTDPDVVRDLIRENPWATLVTATTNGPVASHYPVLLDEDAAELTILTHLGKPDDDLHQLGAHELLVIFQGRHGYISPSWYAPGATQAPTWNFSVAHCYGVPEILSEEENLRTLARLVEHFERHVEEPMLLDVDYAAPIARGTVGLRMKVTRFTCKLKLSQDKDPDTRRQVQAALRREGIYRHPRLAADMERYADS
jgi:transcriptional regulator